MREGCKCYEPNEEEDWAVNSFVIICCDHYHTQTMEKITHELAGSTEFTKCDGTLSYLCVVDDFKSQHTRTPNQVPARKYVASASAKHITSTA